MKSKEGQRPAVQKAVQENEYRALAEFRYHIHRYLEFSDKIALSADVEPRQYQLMLAIRGLPLDLDPTIGVVANRLRIRHHSAVELVNRAEKNGLVERVRDNGTYVFVRLTRKGRDLLEKIVAERLKELRSAGPILIEALQRLQTAKNTKK